MPITAENGLEFPFLLFPPSPLLSPCLIFPLPPSPLTPPSVLEAIGTININALKLLVIGKVGN